MTAPIRALIDDGALHCQACDDSGWLRFECTGDGACQRRRRHLAHTYATECPCRAVNPAYQIKQQRSLRLSAA